MLGHESLKIDMTVKLRKFAGGKVSSLFLVEWLSNQSAIRNRK